MDTLVSDVLGVIRTCLDVFRQSISGLDESIKYLVMPLAHRGYTNLCQESGVLVGQAAKGILYDNVGDHGRGEGGKGR